MPDALPAPTALSAATGPLALVPGDRPWAVLVDRIRGVVTSAEELDAYLATVTAALRDGIAGCDDAVLTRDETAERPEDPEERSPALAVPLVSGDRRLGSLTLYASRPDAFDAEDVAAARTAAVVCADTIAAAEEIIRARTLAAQLEQAMSTRAVIEQAKGILMALRRLTEHEAFEILRKESQDRNIKLRELAQIIVAGTYAAESGRRRRTAS